MAKLFIIVNSNRPRFGALTNRLCTGDPGAINTYVDWLKTILEVIKSRSHIVDGLPTAKPSALRGSAPRSQYNPVPPQKADRPKTTAPPGGTRSNYPQMHPKRGKATDLAQSDKVCCACFRIHTQSKGCVPLSNMFLVITNDPEGAQRIIATYTDKNKTWEETNRHTPIAPKPKRQCATSSDISPLPPAPANDPPPATTHHNYWDSLGSDSDDDTEFSSDISLNRPKEVTTTPEAT